ncbi:MAG TPA: response regulator transcription factor [Methylomirabilota bacterium]|nr:response regulator transcription factor [Methylomirabilota bacterium]
MARVLVVEDDADLRELCAIVLRDAGHEVVEARDGAQAFDRMKTEPSAVVLDLLMPVVDGYEFLKQIRSSSRYASVPVIVVSGTASGKWSLRVGADRYLAKPFDVDVLTSLVGEVIQTG